MYQHLVARTVHPQIQPLTEEAQARWLWLALRDRFPDAIACVLMPNHVHLIAPHDDPAQCADTLRGVTWRFAQHFRLGRVWSPVPDGVPIQGADKLARQVRYVALNPCRKRVYPGATETLASDPLQWLWSTHRDVVGAVADPWVDPDQLKRALESERPWFSRWLHKYVSADPTVHVAGTAPPDPAGPGDTPTHILPVIATAARWACRAPHGAVQSRGAVRRIFVHLAVAQGWRHSANIALVAGCSIRAIQYIRREPIPSGLEAARLCLGDDRLMNPRPLAARSFAKNEVGPPSARRSGANFVIHDVGG